MKQFDVHIGNITTLKVDVIVNAASRSLRGGGEVSMDLYVGQQGPSLMMSALS